MVPRSIPSLALDTARNKGRIIPLSNQFSLSAAALAFGLLASPAATHAATETVVYAFVQKGNGELPSAPLIKVGGKLYGTTYYGGASGAGTVFSVAPDGSHEVVYSFQFGSGGTYPNGGLLDVGGILYGTTDEGGANNDGTVFSISPSGHHEVRYSFQGGSDGAYPESTLINVGGILYGTTAGDNTDGVYGTVFKITPQGAETVLYAFKAGADGGWPSDIINDGNFLYGTTFYGGGSGCANIGCGTVFAVSLQGAETVLYSFGASSDGARPNGPLLKLGNTLYGTTMNGGGGSCGSTGCGTVFKVTLAGVHRTLHSFDGADGLAPIAGLNYVSGALYGTTGEGGARGHGTVFAITQRGVESTVYSFKGGKDGSAPDGDLLNVNGTLYGTTAGGGLPTRSCHHDGCGTVFSITP